MPTSTPAKKSGSRLLNLADTEGLDPFSFPFAEKWYAELVKAGVFPPSAPVYVPAADMADDAGFFVSQGFEVKLGDDDKNALRAAEGKVKGDVTTLGWSLREIKPWFAGEIGAIVDRTVFNGLEEGDRFGYANKVGRLLAPGRPLVGLYRLGRGGVDRDKFERLLHRYFLVESFQLAQVPAPGGPEAWAAVFRRK